MNDTATLVAAYRQNVERAYPEKPYSKTRRARLYRRIFGHWPQRVVDERLHAVALADLEAEFMRRGLDRSQLDVLYPSPARRV